MFWKCVYAAPMWSCEIQVTKLVLYAVTCNKAVENHEFDISNVILISFQDENKIMEAKSNHIFTKRIKVLS